MYFSPPTVLLSAYCQWLPEAMHQEVAKSWPPIWRLASKKKAENDITHLTRDLYWPSLPSEGFFRPANVFNVLSKCNYNTTTLPFRIFCILYTVSMTCTVFFQAENISTRALQWLLTLLSVCCCHLGMSDLVFIRLIKTVWLWIRPECYLFIMYVNRGR